MNKKITIYPIDCFRNEALPLVPRIEITLKPRDNNYALSIVGSFDGSCGQIYDYIEESVNSRDWIMSEGWTKERLLNLLSIWRRWHLNDLTAGTPLQEEFVRNWKALGNKYDYSEVCEAMKKVGIYEDENGYKYGHGWLFEPLPQDVIDFLSEIFKGSRDWDD